MKLIYVCLPLFLMCLSLKGQEKYKTLDTSAINHWETVGSPGINVNGRYAAYMVSVNHSNLQTLHVKGLLSRRDMILKKVKDYSFFKSKNKIAVLEEGDLAVVNLESENSRKYPGVTDFTLLNNAKAEYLICIDSNKMLTVINVKNGCTSQFHNVVSYYINKVNNFIFMVIQKQQQQELISINLDNGKKMMIGKYLDIQNLIFDKTGYKIAFLSTNQATNLKRIYIYKLGERNVDFLTYKNNIDLDPNLSVVALEYFNNDDSQLFVRLQRKTDRENPKDRIVKVWSYNDAVLKSEESKTIPVNLFLGHIDLTSYKLSRIEKEYETAIVLDGKNGNNLVIAERNGGKSEAHWNAKSTGRFTLYNCKSNNRVPLSFGPITMSPDGKYIVGTRAQDNFVVFDITTGKINELQSLNKLQVQNKEIARIDKTGLQIAGWENQHTLFVYDDFDIWKIDVTNPNGAINLTNEYGRKNNITLRFANNIINEKIGSNDTRILSAFDNKNRYNGYFKLVKEGSQDPIKLCLENKFYNAPGNVEIFGMTPIKALEADVWLVRRETCSESANFYITNNFKSFKPLSNIHPENNYNWPSSELINFKMANNKSNQAVLYKPKNFDPSKKYPVILHYYEKMVDRVNQYHAPGLTINSINIPWFVSRGYLVCTPDIHYETGLVGDRALNAVDGIARYLSDVPYVDSSKIGIMGHSFGGYETNYIVTHSTKFAAAVSASGFSNLTNEFVSVTYHGGSNYGGEWAETGQGRLGYALWEKPDIYIKNSPIFFTDKVITPILTMNNELDGVVNVSQGIEFFVALRRLGKRAWMLQYPNEYHSLRDKDHIEDYTRKLEQFFDHFLKDKPAPYWMTRGIPAKLKGIDDGLDLDTVFKIPQSNLLTPKEKKKIDAYSKIPLAEKLKPLTETKSN